MTKIRPLDQNHKTSPISKHSWKVREKDYAEVQSLGQVIKDLEFPFIKNQIITYAERHDPNNELAPKLRDMEERVFECLTSGRSFRDSQII